VSDGEYEIPTRGLTCSQTDSVVVSRGAGERHCGIYVRARALALYAACMISVHVNVCVRVCVCERESVSV